MMTDLATTERTGVEVKRPCRRCRRPVDLHCPGCTTCWPDHSCAADCDAEPEEIAAAAEAIELWEQAHEAAPAETRREDVTL